MVETNFKTAQQLGVIKPWNISYRDDIQDKPEYWDRPDVLKSEGSAMATVQEVKDNPMAGWGDWTPDGKIDQIKEFFRKYLPGNIVVEVGCGGGKQLWAWKEFNNIRDAEFHGGLRLFGIDHSPGAILVAEARMYEVEFRCIGASVFASRLPVKADLVYTHTVLQHNSYHKLKLILQEIHRALTKGGLLWLMNELTIDSKEYVGVYHPEVAMSPWITDERGSHGTATWWIGAIADQGFELLSYEKSSYIFKRI